MSTGVNLARVAPEQLGEVFQHGQGSVRPLAHIESAAHEIRTFNPGGAHSILIGLSKLQGIKIEKDQQGIITALIGLPLPAVNRLLDNEGSLRPSLQSALRPGGSIGYVLADGSIRPDNALSAAVRAGWNAKKNQKHG